MASAQPPGQREMTAVSMMFNYYLHNFFQVLLFSDSILGILKQAYSGYRISS